MTRPVVPDTTSRWQPHNKVCDRASNARRTDRVPQSCQGSRAPLLWVKRLDPGDGSPPHSRGVAAWPCRRSPLDPARRRRGAASCGDQRQSSGGWPEPIAPVRLRGHEPPGVGPIWQEPTPCRASRSARGDREGGPCGAGESVAQQETDARVLARMGCSPVLRRSRPGGARCPGGANTMTAGHVGTRMEVRAARHPIPVSPGIRSGPRVVPHSVSNERPVGPEGAMSRSISTLCGIFGSGGRGH